jgi:outer membrane protein assembly factor BamA
LGTLVKNFFLLIALSLSLTAQGQFSLQVEFSSKPTSEVSTLLKKFEGLLKDTVDLQARLTAIKTTLFAKGYLFSVADLTKQDTSLKLIINPGAQVKTGYINLQLPKGFAIPQYTNLKPYRGVADSTSLRKEINRYLSFFENRGYPFVTITPADYQLINDTLNLNLKINPGPLITIDSLVIKGFDRFSKNVLKYDLKYTKGMLYQERYLNDIINYTNQIEYLQMSRPPAVAFTQSKTVLYTYLEEVKGNQIDGVIGLNTEEDGKVIFNGDIQLRLLHLFKKGEDISIRWRRPDESVQAFNVDLEIPYLIKTPVWLQANLGIFRQDSTFVNTEAQGLLKYLLESGSFLSGGVSYTASNVLLDNESATSFKSFNTTAYKLGLELKKTNRAIVPTKGFKLITYGLTGLRKSEDENQRQYGWQVTADQWIPIFGNHILKLGIRSEALFGGQLYTNELYRIGGLKTLRGFNEQSIYTGRYGIGTIEYRYMIGTYDYLTLFSDLAYAENNAGEQFTSTFLTGLGAGINFQTRAGMFSLFYALGKDDQNPFDLRTSKVHFGYVNRF